ncbi:hypothetical protein [Haloplanus sp. C73]|uniref:hypothetical protein n=1 Tax=Haloplanus sp. C73 TaxID=3421641 RepID=UPI003EBF6297
MATDIEPWWGCPKCGGETETHEDPPPHRTCTTCEWSVSLPTPGEVNDVDW